DRRRARTRPPGARPAGGPRPRPAATPAGTGPPRRPNAPAGARRGGRPARRVTRGRSFLGLPLPPLPGSPPWDGAGVGVVVRRPRGPEDAGLLRVILDLLEVGPLHAQVGVLAPVARLAEDKAEQARRVVVVMPADEVGGRHAVVQGGVAVAVQPQAAAGDAVHEALDVVAVVG